VCFSPWWAARSPIKGMMADALQYTKSLIIRKGVLE
jgi:hypothetical protein